MEEICPFQDRVVLVVGASGGIGSSLTRLLRSWGATVILAGRNSDKLGELAEEVAGHPLTMDATDSEEVLNACLQIQQDHGSLYGVANCAGSLLLKPAHLTKQDEWEWTLNQNLGTAFSVVRAAGRVLAKKGGSVVLVSSAAAQIGLPNHEAIAAAKAGIVGLTQSAAATYARRGIRFNAVSPGLVKSPLTESLLSRPSAEEHSKSMHPLGRIGTPDDIARGIAWLLSPEQSWVTGQVIGIDGGLATVRNNQ